MGVAFERESKRPGETKIRYFDLSLVLVDEEVARLQISVHDPPLVTVEESLEDLPDNGLDMLDPEWLSFLVEILLHILVEKLEN